MYVRVMSAVAVREAMANLAAAYDAFAACDVDALTRTEVVSVIDDLETLERLGDDLLTATSWEQLLQAGGR